MTRKRFALVKCVENRWGVIDYKLEDVDQLILIAPSKSACHYIVTEMNMLYEQNMKLKEDLATRSNQVAFADYLIDDLGHSEMKRQWDDFNKK